MIGPKRSEPFWMIYGLGQGSPTCIHDTFESANTEAERLARQHPGIHFYVLGTMGCAVKTDVEYRRIEIDGIPF